MYAALRPGSREIVRMARLFVSSMRRRANLVLRLPYMGFRRAAQRVFAEGDALVTEPTTPARRVSGSKSPQRVVDNAAGGKEHAPPPLRIYPPFVKGGTNGHGSSSRKRCASIPERTSRSMISPDRNRACSHRILFARTESTMLTAQSAPSAGDRALRGGDRQALRVASWVRPRATRVLSISLMRSTRAEDARGSGAARSPRPERASLRVGRAAFAWEPESRPRRRRGSGRFRSGWRPEHVGVGRPSYFGWRPEPESPLRLPVYGQRAIRERHRLSREDEPPGSPCTHPGWT